MQYHTLSTKMTSNQNLENASQANKPFRLLDLPTELFIHICKCAVELTGEVILQEDLGRKEYASRVQQPNITRVNNFIRKETLPHFYQSNIFRIVDDYSEQESLQRWAKAIGEANLGNAMNLYVDSFYKDFEDWLPKELEEETLPFVIQSQRVVETRDDIEDDDDRGPEVKRFHLGLPSLELKQELEAARAKRDGEIDAQG